MNMKGIKSNTNLEKKYSTCDLKKNRHTHNRNFQAKQWKLYYSHENEKKIRSFSMKNNWQTLSL